MSNRTLELSGHLKEQFMVFIDDPDLSIQNSRFIARYAFSWTQPTQSALVKSCERLVF